MDECNRDSHTDRLPVTFACCIISSVFANISHSTYEDQFLQRNNGDGEKGFSFLLFDDRLTIVNSNIIPVNRCSVRADRLLLWKRKGQ